MPAQPSLGPACKASQERARLSLRNPNWLILRQRQRIVEEGIVRLPAAGLVVLDVGGRLQPYRSLLGPRVKSYVAVDLRLTPLVDVSAAEMMVGAMTSCTVVLFRLDDSL
jgi:hypothetical protein